MRNTKSTMLFIIYYLKILLKLEDASRMYSRAQIRREMKFGSSEQPEKSGRTCANGSKTAPKYNTVEYCVLKS